MVNKTSQSHVEIIMSMVLFIGFLIFVFLFLNPAFKTKKDLTIDKVQEKITDKISSNIGKLSVITASVNDCYSLEKVEKDYGNNFTEVQDLENPRRYTIYYADFFKESIIGNISCSNLPSNFNFGDYVEEKVVVYEKIIGLKELYENDYNSLKNQLEINDFSFEVFDINRNKISDLSINPKLPENVDIVSKDILIRVVDSNANFKILILNLKTWR